MVNFLYVEGGDLTASSELNVKNEVKFSTPFETNWINLAMAEVVSVVDSNDFDVDFFDSVDFNLLGDYFTYNV